MTHQVFARCHRYRLDLAADRLNGTTSTSVGYGRRDRAAPGADHRQLRAADLGGHGGPRTRMLLIPDGRPSTAPAAGISARITSVIGTATATGV